MNYRQVTAGVLCLGLLAGTGCGNKTADTAETAGTTETTEITTEITETAGTTGDKSAEITKLAQDAAEDKLDAATTEVLADFLNLWNTSAGRQSKDNGMKIEYAIKVSGTDESQSPQQSTVSMQFKGDESDSVLKAPSGDVRIYTDGEAAYYDFNLEGNALKYKADFTGQDESNLTINAYGDNPVLNNPDAVTDFADMIDSAEYIAEAGDNTSRYVFSLKTDTDAEDDGTLSPLGILTAAVKADRITELEYIVESPETGKQDITMEFKYDITDLKITPPADLDSYTDMAEQAQLYNEAQTESAAE